MPSVIYWSLSFARQNTLCQICTNFINFGEWLYKDVAEHHGLHWQCCVEAHLPFSRGWDALVLAAFLEALQFTQLTNLCLSDVDDDEGLWLGPTDVVSLHSLINLRHIVSSGYSEVCTCSNFSRYNPLMLQNIIYCPTRWLCQANSHSSTMSFRAVSRRQVALCPIAKYAGVSVPTAMHPILQYLVASTASQCQQ